MSVWTSIDDDRLVFQKKLEMDSLVTHEQLQTLVMQLPVAKLPKAYSLLSDLIDRPADTAPTQEEFFYPLPEEKRHILKEQAKDMVAYYTEMEDERNEWQAGEFSFLCD